MEEAAGAPPSPGEAPAGPNEEERFRKLPTPDGRFFRLRGYPVHDDQGKLIGAVEYGFDITERKRAEEARRKTEAILRAVFEQSPCAILLIDAQTGKTIEFNEQAHQQLGHTREEFSALTVAEQRSGRHLCDEL